MMLAKFLNTEVKVQSSRENRMWTFHYRSQNYKNMNTLQMPPPKAGNKAVRNSSHHQVTTVFALEKIKAPDYLRRQRQG